MEKSRAARSSEEEAELDKKIAQIRERNEKIQQRAQEIEADKLKASGKTTDDSKASKTSPTQASGNKTKGGVWDREWDKGKTPAEQWRENVPSMEITDRDGGGRWNENGGQSSGSRGQRGQRRPNNAPQNVQRKTDGAPAVGGRLAGRISFDKQRTSADSKNGKPTEKRQERSDLKIEVKTPDNRDKRQQPNRPQKNKSSDRPERNNNNSGNNNTHGNHSEQKSGRPRRESDNHAVKTIVHDLVAKIVRQERQAERLPKSKENTDAKPEEAGLAEEKPAEVKPAEEAKPETKPETKPEAQDEASTKDSSPALEEVAEKEDKSQTEETKLSLVTESIVRPQIVA
ncbi:unnamed protein product, partial [Mesorhabditis spiculigera]